MDKFMFDPRRHCYTCGGMGTVGQGSSCQTCGGTGNTREKNRRTKLNENIKWLEDEFSRFVFAKEGVYDGTLEKFIDWLKRN